MNKIKVTILAVSMGVLLGGCKKSFLDINQNPNAPTESSITPDLALAPTLTAAAGRNASSYDFCQRWMGCWSASGSFSRATVEMSYNITNDFGSAIWNGVYYTVSQLKSIEKKSAELEWKFYQGISIIMQAHEIGVLVDFYGNVPYSKAFDLSGNIRPAYDKAEDIYKDLILKIDEGLALIKAADDKDKKIAEIDILFKADKAKWAKFANTIKLRLLLHAYKTTVFDITAEINKITAEGSGFLGDGLGATVHPSLKAIDPGYTPDKPNPYYNAHFFSISGSENDTYNRANNFSLNLMKNLDDPRYKRLYRPAKALPTEFRGTNYGDIPLDDVNSDRTSGAGYGIVANASADMWIISSVEAMFLRAEATARGWITTVDAKTAYENAVKASFTYLGVPDATNEATIYLLSVDPKIGWPTTGGSLEDKIEVIAWQKYFALNGIQGNEIYTDYRRLDVVQPPLSLAPERGTNTIPVRLLYPQSEYNFNKENVGAEGTVSQFTSKLFWDK
jgi:hypothetical protein